MCDNWAMAAGTEFIRSRMAEEIESTFGGCPVPSAGHRIALSHRSLTGFAQRRETLSTDGLPKFRSTSRGHSRVQLSDMQRTLVARVVNFTAVGRRLPQAVLPHEVGETVSRCWLNCRHHLFASCLLCAQAEQFTCSVSVAGTRRSTYETTRISHSQGKWSDQSAYLIESDGYMPAPLRGLAVARVVHFLRVSFVGHEGLPTEFAFSRLYRPTVPAFGYTTVNCSEYRTGFVPLSLIGPPVGLVRSPRVDAPPKSHWVIETHWSDKQRHHIDN